MKKLFLVSSLLINTAFTCNVFDYSSQDEVVTKIKELCPDQNEIKDLTENKIKKSASTIIFLN